MNAGTKLTAVYIVKVPDGVVGTVAGAVVVALGWSVSFSLGAALLVLSLHPVQADVPARAGPSRED